MKEFLHNTFKYLARRLERKSAGLDTLNNVINSINTAYGFGLRKGIGWLSCLGAINYYTSVSPIANAVDLIAQKVAEIYVSIWDKKERMYIKEPLGTGTPTKLLNLLGNFDFCRTYTEGIVAQASYYLITGNCFFICQSTQVNSEPIQLLIAKPQDITIIGANKSIAQQYKWDDGDKNITFVLDPVSMRYYGTDKAGFSYELKHLKSFNPKENTGNLWGMSKLTQIYLELEQHISGAVHNGNLLKNGARPSGVLTLDEDMSNDAYERARSHIKNFYSGSENAGDILIFEGEGTKFESFNLSPRDMDFATLSDKNTVAIYNRLNIPLPFISEKNLTYNNLEEAKFQLYDLAVLPLAEAIFEVLTDLLLYRYKDGENYEIHYDEGDIDVLATKKRREDAETIKLGITTMNEARGMYSLQELAQGGDEVLINPSLVPLGQPAEEKGQKIVPKEDFVRILRKQNFEQKEIDEAVIRIYGRD